MADFEITRIQKVTILTREGLPVQGRRIHFVLSDLPGYDWIEVPDDEFDADKIGEMIQEHVDKVKQLVSNSTE